NGGQVNEAAGVLNNGTLSALDSTFTNNTVFGPNTQGGAIFNNGTLRVARCTFVNNAASISGGGIYTTVATSLGAVRVGITNSTFVGNTAGDGSALYDASQLFNGGFLEIVNCTFSGNGPSIPGNGGITISARAGKFH